MPSASLGSIMAGWTSATAVKGVGDWDVRETIYSHVLAITSGLPNPLEKDHEPNKNSKKNKTHLPTPTHPQTPPLLHPLPLPRPPNLLQQLPHFLTILPGLRRPRKEIPHRLLFLVRIGREHTVRERFTVEEDAVLVVGVVGVGEDVGALEGLGGEAEDVVDY